MVEQNSSYCQKAKLLSIAILCLCMMCSVAMAKPSPRHEGGFIGAQGADVGGFQGPGPAVITVKEAQALGDGVWVALRGKISHSLGDKEFMFSDDTGTIEIHIGPREWQGQYVTPNDSIEIHGKVKKNWTNTHIHVKKIVKK